MLALPGLSLWANNAARGGTPAPAPTGPDIAALAAMFAVDATGASAAQLGGLWSAYDTTKLFQSSAGTGAVAADADPVGYMQDLSGNGNHMLQTTAGNRPLFKTSGGRNWLEFDGSNDFMKPAAQMITAQPWTVLAAIRQISWTSGDFIISPYTGASHLVIYQTGTSPSLTMDNGGLLATTALSVGTDGVLYAKANGASSVLQIDNLAATAGNGGVGVTGGGFSIGGDGGGGHAANVRVYAFLAIGRVLTAPEVALAKTEFAKCYGGVL